MDRRIKVGPGMLDQPPPVKVEAVLLEVEGFLVLDPRDAEERREVRRHGVGQINGPAEPLRPRLRRVRGDRGCGKGRRRSLEEVTSRQRLPYRFLAAGNAHAGPPSIAIGLRPPYQ